MTSTDISRGQTKDWLSDTFTTPLAARVLIGNGSDQEPKSGIWKNELLLEIQAVAAIKPIFTRAVFRSRSPVLFEENSTGLKLDPNNSRVVGPPSWSFCYDAELSMNKNADINTQGRLCWTCRHVRSRPVLLMNHTGANMLTKCVPKLAASFLLSKESCCAQFLRLLLIVIDDATCTTFEVIWSANERP